MPQDTTEGRRDAWGQPVTDDTEFYAESEDLDDDDERRGPAVSIWRAGGDGTFIEVYGADIEEARALAGRAIDALHEAGSGVR